ncbi:MAG: DUF2304 domain-containing protein [Candidatus Omnitrophica bacterium]|nr:DUF2304 domain-containing protein [Candidatus Omnitrophota bacterium]MCM8793089.1 DUF2304 domain-containing protein [Candidatus Omnitrophota bacterium]
MDKVQIFSVFVSFFLLWVILHLIKIRRLGIQYSIVWLITGLVLLILSFWRDLLEKMAEWIGIHYPPSLLFLLGFFFSLIILLHFSVIVTQLTEMNKELAQKISLLNLEIEELRKKL